MFILFPIGKILYEKLNRREDARSYFQRLVVPPYDDIEWGSVARKYIT